MRALRDRSVCPCHAGERGGFFGLGTAIRVVPRCDRSVAGGEGPLCPFRSVQEVRMSKSGTEDRGDGPRERDGGDRRDRTPRRDVPVISVESWWPGDVIGLPPEPPLGTELQVDGGGYGGLIVVRSADGWSAADGTWRGMFGELGPASAAGVTFVVVRAPMRCAGCERWLPVDAPAQQRYHDDNCRRRSSRSRHGGRPT